MTSSVLGMIKEEVTCPICLDLMVEPVSADCGHSFCRACITLNYESSKIKEGEGICPMCQVSYVFGNLRPNWHMANIVERLKGFKTSSEEEQKVDVCAQHGEKLQLFCEKDMVAICWLCERSQEHRGHQTALIEEVANKYKGMLQAALEMQMANEKRCDQWEDDLQKERTSWENQMQRDIENVQKEFKGLRKFLDSKEKNEVEELVLEKEDTMNILAVSQTELEKQRESVRDLISDLEHRLECSAMEMLQGVNSVLTRSQNLRLKQPKMVPTKQRKIFQAPDLKGMLQVFQGLLDAQRHWVHVTLPQCNNKNIVINMDKRQIQHRSGYRRNLEVSESYDLGVLGYPAIHSGKHYWEVDVSGCDAWLLGINDGRCAQPQLPSMTQQGFKDKYNSDVNQDVNYQPEYNFGYEYKYDFGDKHIYADYQPKYEVEYYPGDKQFFNYQLESAFDCKYKQDFGDKQYVNYQTKHEVIYDPNDGQHVNYQPKCGYWVIGMRNRATPALQREIQPEAQVQEEPMRRAFFPSWAAFAKIQVLLLYSEGVRTILNRRVGEIEKKTLSLLWCLLRGGARELQKDREQGIVVFGVRTDRLSITATMASSVLGMIKEEVTCPICLELLKEPVNADCGHIFCQACITLNYESSKGKEGEGICPVCRVSYLFGNLRPIRHVANIVERLKEFKSSPEEEQKVNVCAQHGEKLQLFCEKDMVAICWLCERSQEHRGHQTALIEEVAIKYKGMLQAALEMQMANEKRCDQWEDDLQKERTSWENEIQSEVENVQKEFKGLWEFLDSKEKNELQKLMKEKEDILNILEDSQTELEKQRESVKDLISDLEHRLECSTMEMLQGVNWVLIRSQNLRLKQPKMVPSKQRKIFRAPDLKGMLQVFQGLLDAQRHWVDVTLPQHNNKNIVINRNKRQIQHRSGYRRNLEVSESYDLGVLGYPVMRSGKHYWEVDVSGCDAWLLGINDGRCAQPQLPSMNQQSFKDKYNSVVNQDVNYKKKYAVSFGSKSYFVDKQSEYEAIGNSDNKQHVNYQRKYGYWVIGMRNRSVYNAFEECSVTHNASVLLLSLTCPPTRVGVFLDREACTLSFYDVSNHGALIYRFCEPNFPNAVYPYFNPMECSEPLTVCGPPS
uniref:uncharacterized protein LOC125397248 n=1 Tax=Myodes glareolus TaxID=447135 RepID=UPI0020226C74|nr:uncharacterized protein LOC125397248 [Myodes glareolus]